MHSPSHKYTHTHICIHGCLCICIKVLMSKEFTPCSFVCYTYNEKGEIEEHIYVISRSRSNSFKQVTSENLRSVLCMSFRSVVVNTHFFSHLSSVPSCSATPFSAASHLGRLHWRETKRDENLNAFFVQSKVRYFPITERCLCTSTA